MRLLHLPTEPAWNIVGVIRPCMAEGHRRTRLGAAGVASAADVKVGPLREVARTRDARRVGLEKVGLIQRCGPLYTG